MMTNTTMTTKGLISEYICGSKMAPMDGSIMALVDGSMVVPMDGSMVGLMDGSMVEMEISTEM